MTEEEKKEGAIQMIADLMRNEPFQLQFKVVKKPKGIKIIYEVTQQLMDEIVKGGMLTKKGG